MTFERTGNPPFPRYVWVAALSWLVLAGCEPTRIEPKLSNRPAGEVYQLDQDNFIPLVIRSAKPVLVEFWGPNCPPCREMEPMIAELAREHREFSIGKLNVQTDPGIAERFNVTLIPTFLVFREGEVTQHLVGLQNVDRLLAALKGETLSEEEDQTATTQNIQDGTNPNSEAPNDADSPGDSDSTTQGP